MPFLCVEEVVHIPFSHSLSDLQACPGPTCGLIGLQISEACRKPRNSSQNSPLFFFLPKNNLLITTMPAASRPHKLRDRLVQARVDRQRDEFVASIPKHRVCDLASSHRAGKPCTSFQEPLRGSYNVCYFVRFDDGVKWVVRVPLAPCLGVGARVKLESEVAAMQYVFCNYFLLAKYAN